MSASVAAEPVALRAELRRLVGERPGEAHALVASSLCGYLGAAWDVDEGEADLLARVVEGARYEAYLWVMGDRRWSQLADTLAGRMARRRDHPAGRARAAAGGELPGCR